MSEGFICNSLTWQFSSTGDGKQRTVDWLACTNAVLLLPVQSLNGTTLPTQRGLSACIMQQGSVYCILLL